jgi:hypothetical protein
MFLPRKDRYFRMLDVESTSIQKFLIILKQKYVSEM